MGPLLKLLKKLLSKKKPASPKKAKERANEKGNKEKDETCKKCDAKVKNPPETQRSVDDKLDKYLLNKDHPVGKEKANWFEKALGFNKGNSSELSKQIQFDLNKATPTQLTQYGQKFNQVIPIKGLNGKTIDVKFAWIKNNDGIVRLVTGVPAK